MSSNRSDVSKDEKKKAEEIKAKESLEKARSRATRVMKLRLKASLTTVVGLMKIAQSNMKKLDEAKVQKINEITKNLENFKELKFDDSTSKKFKDYIDFLDENQFCRLENSEISEKLKKYYKEYLSNVQSKLTYISEDYSILDKVHKDDGECAVFLMSSQINGNYKKSDYYHLYLYQRENGEVFYQMEGEKGENKEYNLPMSNYLKEYIKHKLKFDQPENDPVKCNNPHATWTILRITSELNHTSGGLDYIESILNKKDADFGEDVYKKYDIAIDDKIKIENDKKHDNTFFAVNKKETEKDERKDDSSKVMRKRI